ncbi:hypothetical protein L7F22_046491 [Adiantum nelumboides]|nr:hypothetical protein [Adiantum nelumboides]
MATPASANRIPLSASGMSASCIGQHHPSSVLHIFLSPAAQLSLRARAIIKTSLHNAYRQLAAHRSETRSSRHGSLVCSARSLCYRERVVVPSSRVVARWCTRPALAPRWSALTTRRQERRERQGTTVSA